MILSLEEALRQIARLISALCCCGSRFEAVIGFTREPAGDTTVLPKIMEERGRRQLFDVDQGYRQQKN